jgi:hypothetical protein
VTTLPIQGSPDAIDRYWANTAKRAATTLPLGGSPDAIDRYNRVEMPRFNIYGSVSAEEPVHVLPVQGSPDAIDRFRQGRTVTIPSWLSQLRQPGGTSDLARFQNLRGGPGAGGPVLPSEYLGHELAGPGAAGPIIGIESDMPVTDGFNWGDFGIGAASMFGLAMLLAGLGLGALAVRHRGGQLRTS